MIINITGTDKHFFIDNNLIKKLDLMISRFKSKFDNVIIIDGDEGYGKTTLAIQICYYISQKTGREFNIENIFWDVPPMMKKASETKELILLNDEAAIGALSSDHFLKTQTQMIKLLMTARKKLHFYVFVIPKVFKLREYIVSRAVCLIHVYARHEKERGMFVYFKKEKKEALYNYWKTKKIEGYRRFFSFHGTFPSMFEPIIDEAEYDRRKDKAILSIFQESPESAEVSKLKEKYEKLQAAYARIEGIKAKDLAKNADITPNSLTNWRKIGKKLSMLVENTNQNGTSQYSNVPNDPNLIENDSKQVETSQLNKQETPI